MNHKEPDQIIIAEARKLKRLWDRESGSPLMYDEIEQVMTNIIAAVTELEEEEQSPLTKHRFRN